VRAPHTHGQEFALAVESGAAGYTPAEQLVWLRHALGPALQAGARVALDLTAAVADARGTAESGVRRAYDGLVSDRA